MVLEMSFIPQTTTQAVPYATANVPFMFTEAYEVDLNLVPNEEVVHHVR